MAFEPLWEALSVGGPAGVFKGFTGFYASVRFRAANFWTDFLAAVPNPFRMIDEVLKFATSIGGLVVSAPFEGQKQLILKQLQVKGVHNKLIRVDDAVNAVFETQIQLVRQFSNTDENGIIEFFLQWVATSVYRLVKKVLFLEKLLGVRSEAELVRVVIQSWRSKFNLLRWIAVIMSITVLIIAYSIGVSMFAFAYNFGTFKAFILPQDSKRVRVKRGRHQMRFNLRTRADYPP